MKFVMEVDQAEPLVGRLSTPEGRVHLFEGWSGLAAAMSSALSESQGAQGAGVGDRSTEEEREHHAV